MAGNLLPTNATPWEGALADAIDDFDPLAGPAERIRSAKRVSPPSDFVPFLIAEYGLGELTPYVVNHYDLLRDGVKWQRLRGTPAAVSLGLSWLALSAAIVEARHDRRFWNSFQLYLTTLPGADTPDLERIENIASLSVPLRSKLRRGVHGYDVPMLVTDRTPLDASVLDSDSGVAVRAGGARWSFGREFDLDHLFTEAEGVALGNWIEPPVPENLQWGGGNWNDPPDAAGGLTWRELSDVPWLEANFSWLESGVSARQAVLAAWFRGRVVYALFRRDDGSVIGFRRCRAVHPVRAAVGGLYSFGGVTYSPQDGGGQLYLEALTGFNDADEDRAAEVSLYVGGTLAPGVGPGRLWLRPSEISGGVAFAAKPLSITLRRTVRERVKFLVRF